MWQIFAQGFIMGVVLRGTNDACQYAHRKTIEAKNELASKRKQQTNQSTAAEGGDAC